MANAGTKLYTLREAAERMNVSEYTVRRICWAHEIDFIQAGKNGRISISEDAIAAWLARLTVAARQAPDGDTLRGRYGRRAARPQPKTSAAAS